MDVEVGQVGNLHWITLTHGLTPVWGAMVSGSGGSMAVDARRVLDEASRDRVRCELMPRAGGLVDATLIRVESGGVVVYALDGRFVGGEDVRVWFSHEGRAWSFEASIVRVGVPIPTRGRGGLLLGFIDCLLYTSPSPRDS